MRTITIPYGGELRNLTLITEGNYSSEYLLRSSTQEFRLKIRHSKEKAAKGAVPFDRHNVEFTVRTFPTVALPQGSQDQTYAVIRSNPNTDGSSAAKAAEVVAGILLDYSSALVGWESDLANAGDGSGNQPGGDDGDGGNTGGGEVIG